MGKLLAFEERTSQSLRSTTSVAAGVQWVINLASLSSKADADRFAEVAHAKGIETEHAQLQILVEGLEYHGHRSGKDTGYECIFEPHLGVGHHDVNYGEQQPHGDIGDRLDQKLDQWF